jgi:catechol 2,3-dioxygenase-like lactoylglutathione lyase family enzyme
MGYRELAPGLWSDGDSSVRLNSVKEAQSGEIGFLIQGGHQLQSPVQVSPTGIVIGMESEVPPLDSGIPQATSSYIMNHVSIQTPDVDADHRWFTSFLGEHTVISDPSHFNPLDNRKAPEVHLWRDRDFYVTLRELPGEPRIDHVGWMAASQDLVDDAAEMLERLGLQIVMGPLYIDGSYLVHFRGPDGRTHDFFFPTSMLASVGGPQ